MAKTKRALSKAFVRRTVILSTLLMALLVLTGLLYWKKRPQLLRERADAALAAGQYAAAASLYEKLEQTDEVAQQLLAAQYGSAQELLDAGKFAEAETAFSGLGAYADAREKILACRYGLAEKAYRDGDYADAKTQFYALSGS